MRYSGTGEVCVPAAFPLKPPDGIQCNQHSCMCLWYLLHAFFPVLSPSRYQGRLASPFIPTEAFAFTTPSPFLEFSYIHSAFLFLTICYECDEMGLLIGGEGNKIFLFIHFYTLSFSYTHTHILSLSHPFLFGEDVIHDWIRWEVIPDT